MQTLIRCPTCGSVLGKTSNAETLWLSHVKVTQKRHARSESFPRAELFLNMLMCSPGHETLQLKGDGTNACSGQLLAKENGEWKPVKENRSIAKHVCKVVRCGAIENHTYVDHNLHLTCTGKQLDSNTSSGSFVIVIPVFAYVLISFTCRHSESCFAGQQQRKQMFWFGSCKCERCEQTCVRQKVDSTEF